MTTLDKQALIEAMGKAIEHELLTGDHDCLALNEIVVAKAALRALAEALPDVPTYREEDLSGRIVYVFHQFFPQVETYRQLKEFARE